MEVIHFHVSPGLVSLTGMAFLTAVITPVGLWVGKFRKGHGGAAVGVITEILGIFRKIGARFDMDFVVTIGLRVWVNIVALHTGELD